jgi:hypothetical protein
VPDHSMPQRPRDVFRVALVVLAGLYHEHLGPTINALHGIGKQLPREQVARHAVAALAIGQAIEQYVRGDRWSTVRDALTYGATVAEVAGALDLELDEVAAGVTSWADGQARSCGMTADEHARVIALVLGDATRP